MQNSDMQEVKMSLWVYLGTWERNITHNYGSMANVLGCYEAIWRPEEIGISQAKEIVPFLEKAIVEFDSKIGLLNQEVPENGWGDTDGFKEFLDDYLCECKKHPELKVSISR